MIKKLLLSAAFVIGIAPFSMAQEPETQNDITPPEMYDVRLKHSCGDRVEMLNFIRDVGWTPTYTGVSTTMNTEDGVIFTFERAFREGEGFRIEWMVAATASDQLCILDLTPALVSVDEMVEFMLRQGDPS